MSYLICEDCGKQYPLPEGEESFNYEKCSCGGRLRYSPTSKSDYAPKKFNDQNKDSFNGVSTSQGNTTSKDYSNSKTDIPVFHKTYSNIPGDAGAQIKTNTGGIKWKGVMVGLLFLFASLVVSVMITFGEDVPQDPSSIPIQIISYLSMLTIILTIMAGGISAYVSGSRTYLEGAINGSMVGVILGLILGLVGGLMVFISGTLIFGLLSMVGGIIGIFPRKLSKKK